MEIIFVSKNGNGEVVMNNELINQIKKNQENTGISLSCSDNPVEDIGELISSNSHPKFDANSFKYTQLNFQNFEMTFKNDSLKVNSNLTHLL